MYLTTARLIIRPVTMDDAAFLHSIFRLPEVMQPVGLALAFTEMNQTMARLSGWIADGMHHAVVLAGSERVIGYIIIKPDSEEGRADTKELGFALHPDCQRNGYMTEAVKAVLECLYQAGVRYVWACCFQDNPASKALIERCGFIFQQAGEYTAVSEHKTYPSFEYRIDLRAE